MRYIERLPEIQPVDEETDVPLLDENGEELPAWSQLRTLVIHVLSAAVWGRGMANIRARSRILAAFKDESAAFVAIEDDHWQKGVEIMESSDFETHPRFGSQLLPHFDSWLKASEFNPEKVEAVRKG